MAYERIPPKILDELDDRWLFEKVFTHVQELLGDKWFPNTNVEKLEGTPGAARTIYHLFAFQCRLMTDNMSGCVANGGPNAQEIIAFHSALKAVGASDLLELLEASFTPARLWDADFLRDPEVGWFDQFRANPKWLSFEEINPAACAIGGDKLASLAADYIRVHRGEL